MGILDQEAVAGFLRMCDDGWLQGWHERNGGNLTCRLLPGEVERCRPWLHAPLRRAELGVEAPELAGEYFLTTGSGKYFRNVRRAPLENIGIVRIDGSGSAYEIVWGLEGDARPTSEFASHILNHRVRREVTRGRDRVIYHAHTPALIAMTYILPLTDRDFTRILWKSATECPVVFPACLLYTSLGVWKTVTGIGTLMGVESKRNSDTPVIALQEPEGVDMSLIHISRT